MFAKKPCLQRVLQGQQLHSFSLYNCWGMSRGRGKSPFYKRPHLGCENNIRPDGYVFALNKNDFENLEEKKCSGFTFFLICPFPVLENPNFWVVSSGQQAFSMDWVIVSWMTFGKTHRHVTATWVIKYIQFRKKNELNLKINYNYKLNHYSGASTVAEQFSLSASIPCGCWFVS